MSRFLLTCLLLGTWTFVAVAAETTASSTSNIQYVAKIKFLRVSQKDKQNTTVETEVTGVKGTPLKTDLGGSNGMVLQLDIRDIAGTRPTQYLAGFRLVKREKDAKQHVLSEPRIVTVVGRPAKFMVGEEGKDRIEVNLIVNEGAKVNHGAPKPATQNPTTKEQPRVPVGLEGTTSLMKMVTPRIIIQDEEEEKLGIQPTP